MTHRGFTLLETMIALVVLAAFGTAVLQIVAGASRTTGDLAIWAEAVAAAESGLVAATLDTPDAQALPPLPAGFTRRIEYQPRAGGLVEVTVTVGLPNGRTFALSRLLLDDS